MGTAPKKKKKKKLRAEGNRAQKKKKQIRTGTLCAFPYFFRGNAHAAASLHEGVDFARLERALLATNGCCADLELLRCEALFCSAGACASISGCCGVATTAAGRLDEMQRRFKTESAAVREAAYFLPFRTFQFRLLTSYPYHNIVWRTCYFCSACAVAATRAFGLCTALSIV